MERTHPVSHGTVVGEAQPAVAIILARIAAHQRMITSHADLFSEKLAIGALLTSAQFQSLVASAKRADALATRLMRLVEKAAPRPLVAIAPAAFGHVCAHESTTTVTRVASGLADHTTELGYCAHCKEPVVITFFPNHIEVRVMTDEEAEKLAAHEARERTADTNDYGWMS